MPSDSSILQATGYIADERAPARRHNVDLVEKINTIASPFRKKVTRKLVIQKLKKLQTGLDPENHEHADRILCELLRTIGYNDVVDEYVKVQKNY